MITIDTKDRRPIYEQLIEDIKRQIIEGTLSPDEQLPSVRQLAATLAINPNTIQKAYSILEREGVIYSLGGRGNYISTDTQSIRAKKTSEILDELRDSLTKAKECGVAKSIILDHVSAVYGAL